MYIYTVNELIEFMQMSGYDCSNRLLLEAMLQSIPNFRRHLEQEMTQKIVEGKITPRKNDEIF